MPLPVIDSHARFSCGGCSRCCTQPWAILIEKDKIRAIEQHGLAGYQHLAGKKWFETSKDIDERYLVIPKQHGTTRCLFLDHDGLCIIHKELGSQAKPIACQKFPFHVSHTPVDDRVSLNFGCPNVQQDVGVPLVDQRSAIAATCEQLDRTSPAASTVPLVAGSAISRDKFEALLETFEFVFSREISVWSCFAQSLSLSTQLAQHAQLADEDVRHWLQRERQCENLPVMPFPSAVAAPRPSRMLFAGTMLRDVVPADVTLNMNLWGRITLLPRLMTLVKLSGSYQSKLLQRRVDVDRVLKHPMNGIASAASALLRRYLRTRLWQRLLVGNRLSVVAGIHQHILDVNAIIFLARAMAEPKGITTYSDELIAESLSLVEMNIANQARVFDQPSLSFFSGMLDNAEFAQDSLRMLTQGLASQPKLPPLATQPTGNESYATVV